MADFLKETLDAFEKKYGNVNNDSVCLAESLINVSDEDNARDFKLNRKKCITKKSFPEILTESCKHTSKDQELHEDSEFNIPKVGLKKFDQDHFIDEAGNIYSINDLKGMKKEESLQEATHLNSDEDPDPMEKDDRNSLWSHEDKYRITARGSRSKENKEYDFKRKSKQHVENDIEKYQKWVDFDMSRYGKISKRTQHFVDKAGLQILKDDHGDYEVAAGNYDEGLKGAILGGVIGAELGHPIKGAVMGSKIQNSFKHKNENLDESFMGDVFDEMCEVAFDASNEDQFMNYRQFLDSLKDLGFTKGEIFDYARDAYEKYTELWNDAHQQDDVDEGLGGALLGAGLGALAGSSLAKRNQEEGSSEKGSGLGGAVAGAALGGLAGNAAGEFLKSKGITDLASAKDALTGLLAK